jgi:hypothetical protein
MGKIGHGFPQFRGQMLALEQYQQIENTKRYQQIKQTMMQPRNDTNKLRIHITIKQVLG